MHTVHQIINFISATLMLFFALPKILGGATSIQGFQQFGTVLHLPPDFFRIFTGFSELAIAALIVLFSLKKGKLLGRIAFSFLLVTMLTALGIEFFARPEPKVALVTLAIALASLSTYRLKTIH